MIIDKIDLLILRYLEHRGQSIEAFSKQLGLTLADVEKRIKNMEDERVISDYKSSIFVPSFVGGDWTWGVVFIKTDDRVTTSNTIIRGIPFVTEIAFNTTIPLGIGHNLSVLLYSQNFDATLKYLKQIPKIIDISAYRINNYSYPIAQVFSSEEKMLLKTILNHPIAKPDKLAELCLKDISWVGLKLEKLIFTQDNPNGIIITLPEINYVRLENFCHCHFILEPRVKPELLFDELKTFGFELVLDGKFLFGHYLQLEADIWGFSDLISKICRLQSYSDIKLHGISFAEKRKIISDWTHNLINF